MLRALRLSFGFLTPGEKRVYVALVAGRAISGILDVIGVFLIGAIASLGTAQFNVSGEPMTIMGFTLPVVGPEVIMWLVVIVLVVFIGKSALAILLSRRLAMHLANVETRNAKLIAEYLLTGSLDNAKKYSIGEYQHAVVGSTTAAFGGILNTVATFVCEGFLLILVSTAFFVVSPAVAFFALLYFVGIAFTIQVLVGGTLKRAGQEATQGAIGTASVLFDSLETFRELSVMGKQDYYIDRMVESRRRLARSGATAAYMSGMPRYVIETALIVGVVALVAQQFLSNGLASGIVVLGVFLAGGMRIMASLLPLQASFTTSKLYVEQCALAHELLTAAHARRGSAVEAVAVDVPEMHAVGLDVEIDEASFSYPGETHLALDAVSVKAAAGAFTAIIGPSGSGKTTLVDLLLGLLIPDTGTVRIGPARPHDIRFSAPGVISYVPQRPGMVAGTIAENIALGVAAEDIDRDRLAEVVDAAFLSEFVDSLPNGVDSSVGKQSNSLSGGQIQRIGLARALYTNPRLLIMDEATSALDASSEAFISESLQRLHGHVTVVVIAHRLSTVQHADHVYVMNGGAIAAEGTFRHLMKNNPMVAEYVKLMSFDEQKDEAMI
ncbi:ABC transporter ATP-binding protein [Agromyces sp. NPDC055520]